MRYIGLICFLLSTQAFADIHTNNTLVNSTGQTITCQISRTFGDKTWFNLKNTDTEKSVVDQQIVIPNGGSVPFGLYLLKKADFQMAFTIHCFLGTDPGGMNPELSYVHAVISAKHAADPNIHVIHYNQGSNSPTFKYTSNGQGSLTFTINPPANTCGYRGCFGGLVNWVSTLSIF
jgi:hypothetical protein